MTCVDFSPTSQNKDEFDIFAYFASTLLGPNVARLKALPRERGARLGRRTVDDESAPRIHQSDWFRLVQNTPVVWTRFGTTNHWMMQHAKRMMWWFTMGWRLEYSRKRKRCKILEMCKKRSFFAGLAIIYFHSNVSDFRPNLGGLFRLIENAQVV